MSSAMTAPAKKKNNGFTVIELLLAFTLLAAILSLVSGFFFTVIRNHKAIEGSFSKFRAERNFIITFKNDLGCLYPGASGGFTGTRDGLTFYSYRKGRGIVMSTSRFDALRKEIIRDTRGIRHKTPVTGTVLSGVAAAEFMYFDSETSAWTTEWNSPVFPGGIRMAIGGKDDGRDLPPLYFYIERGRVI